MVFATHAHIVGFLNSLVILSQIQPFSKFYSQHSNLYQSISQFVCVFISTPCFFSTQFFIPTQWFHCGKLVTVHHRALLTFLFDHFRIEKRPYNGVYVSFLNYTVCIVNQYFIATSTNKTLQQKNSYWHVQSFEKYNNFFILKQLWNHEMK